MDGNFLWQQIRANERGQSRLKDAEVHRLVNVCENGRLPILHKLIAPGKLFCILGKIFHLGLSNFNEFDEEVHKSERAA